MFDYFNIIFLYPLMIYYLVSRLEMLVPNFNIIFSLIKIIIVYYEMLIMLVLGITVATHILGMIVTRRFIVLSNYSKVHQSR